MTEKEKEELARAFATEFEDYTALCDRLLKAMMALPPMGKMTQELIANPEVKPKEMFQLGFMQGVITATRAHDPKSLMHEYFKKALE
jgi:hypothetical protein